MSAKNSLSSQLEDSNRHHNNAVLLGNAYLDALTSTKSNVSVDIVNADGTNSTIVIPSNIYISNELERLKSSLKNATSLSTDSKKKIVANDGTWRELLVSNYKTSKRKLISSDITVNNTIKISTNSQIESLLSPLTEVVLSLSSEYADVREAVINKFIIKENDLSLFSEGMSIGDARKIIAQNSVEYTLASYTRRCDTKVSRWYGEFNVNTSQVNEYNQLVIKLDTLLYSDNLNVVENSRVLSVGDKLTSNDGSLLVSVVDVNTVTSTITCEFVAGVGSISENDTIFLRGSENSITTISVPVRMNELSILFIQPLDATTSVAASNSTSILFDASKFIVVNGNETSTFNEFFSSKVSDIGYYFDAVIKENQVPVSLGIKPEKPELVSSNFNVVQINQHLTNTSSSLKLQKLQKEKDVVNSQLSVLTSTISDLNIKIAKGNYSTESKKSSDVSLRTTKITEKLQKTSLLSSIVSDMTTALNDSAEMSITPKYRVRGFWKVQPDIVSGITNPQKIVQYSIRYRYVSNTGNTANATQMSYTDEGNVINATFTPWTNVKSEPLERSIDIDGNVSWSSNSPSDADVANINQLDIPITYGESVEIQVKSISEAGWPNAPMTSDWSSLTRVDFPIELLQESDIASIARKNTDDQFNVKLQNEFAVQGITEHIAKSFREQEKYFAHGLNDIASGRVTTEQKQISAEEYIITLEKRISLLEELVNKRYAVVTLQLLDASLRTYDINNFSTINIFAGYYSEDVDLTEPANYGSIVEKTFYLKLINRNAQTVEMLSIEPGILSSSTQSAKYSDVPVWLSTDAKATTQKKGQIFYNRKFDINGDGSVDDNNLYENITSNSNITVTSADIDSSAQTASKNVVHKNGTLVETVKLIQGASLNDYVAMTTTHPSYIDYVSTNNVSILNAEFTRLQKFNKLYRERNKQQQLTATMIPRFDINDKYLVGKNSVGSILITSINNLQAYQVNGIDTSSAKEIFSGDQDSILIPITFQYRMTDALGNPSGDASLSQNANFEYSKKLGFDVYIAGKLLSFDVSVSAKFRPTSISNNNVGIQQMGSITTTPNVT